MIIIAAMLMRKKVQEDPKMQEETKLIGQKLKAGKYLSTLLRARNTRQIKYQPRNTTYSHSYQSFCSSSFDGTPIFSSFLSVFFNRFLECPPLANMLPSSLCSSSSPLQRSKRWWRTSKGTRRIGR